MNPPLPKPEQALAYYLKTVEACASYPDAITQTLRLFGELDGKLAMERYAADMAESRARGRRDRY